MQNFNFNSVANANCSAMEAETIQKNAVSPKSQTSRKNNLVSVKGADVK